MFQRELPKSHKNEKDARAQRLKTTESIRISKRRVQEAHELCEWTCSAFRYRNRRKRRCNKGARNSGRLASSAEVVTDVARPDEPCGRQSCLPLIADYLLVRGFPGRPRGRDGIWIGLLRTPILIYPNHHISYIVGMWHDAIIIVESSTATGYGG